MASKYDDEIHAQVRRVVKAGVAAIVVIFLLVLVFSTFYTVPSGQEGVLLTFGKADMVAIQPGLHIKVPFVQNIVKFDIRTQKYGISSLQNGPNGGEGGSLESGSSSDMQIVSLQMVVNYHLTPGTTPQIWSKIGPGYEDTVVQPSVHESTKAAVAQFTATDLIDRREDVRLKIEDLLRGKLAPYNIVVEQVSIVNLDFSKQFNDAIESKVTAQQLKEKADNDLQRIKVEADQVRAAAAGQRDAMIAQATGEAQKVKLIQEQLRQSPQYIEYVKAQRWSGALPQIVMSTNWVTPFMQIPNVLSSDVQVAAAQSVQNVSNVVNATSAINATA